MKSVSAASTAAADRAKSDEEKSFLLFGTLSVFFGNMATIFILAVAYINYRLFENYAQMLLWAALLAIGLDRTKSFLAASSDKKWIPRIREALLRRVALYAFLAISWLWALCNTFGFVSVLSVHFASILLAFGYVRLSHAGFALHKRIGCSNAAAGTLVLLVGAFVFSGVVLVFFVLKCSEEGAEAFRHLSEWGASLATPAGEEHPNALGVQINKLLEMEQVQEAIESAREAVGGMLDSLTEVGGEGLVNRVRDCYEQTGGHEGQIIECLWGDDGFSVGDTLSQIWEDVKTFNLTDIAVQGGLTTINVVTSVASSVVSMIGFFVTRGSEVMTSVIMLWYLLTSQSDWLGNVVANCMPMASTHRHRAVKRHLTVVVEAAIIHPVQLAIVRSLVTWSVLNVLGVPYRHFATLAVAVTAFVPLIVPVLTLLPWIVADLFFGGQSTWFQYFWLGGTGLRGIIVLVVALVVLPSLETSMDTETYKNIHPYAISLAIYAGFSAWGTAGIILGPICMLLLGIVHGMYAPVAEEIDATPAKSDHECNSTTSTRPSEKRDSASDRHNRNDGSKQKQKKKKKKSE